MKKIVVALIFILLFVENSFSAIVFESNTGTKKIININNSDVYKGFFRGGSLIYSTNNGTPNMLKKGQFLVYKLIKYSGETHDEIALVCEEYGIIKISTINNNEFSFNYTKWDSGIVEWKTVKLEFGKECDLNEDGLNDLRWEAGEDERGWGSDRYLTFLSSQKNKHITMYQLKEDWTPDGYFPYGIISISPNSGLCINQRTLGSRISKKSISSLPFLKNGDNIYTNDGELETISARNDDSTLTISLEELKNDSILYHGLKEATVFDVYEYIDKIYIDGTSTDKGRATNVLSVSKDFYFIGNENSEQYLKVFAEAGVRFVHEVKFKAWWFGMKADMKIETTPFIKAGSEAKFSGSEISKNNAKITLWEGLIIPLTPVPGNLVIGETYFSVLAKLHSTRKGKLKFDYTFGKTYYNETKAKAGFNWSDGFYGTWKPKETEEPTTVSLFQFNDGAMVYNEGDLSISVTPTLTFKCYYDFYTLVKAYVNYNIGLENKYAFTTIDDKLKYNCELKGWGSSGIRLGMKKTIKLWGWKYKINMSHNWSFGKFGEWDISLVDEETKTIQNEIELTGNLNESGKYIANKKIETNGVTTVEENINIELEAGKTIILKNGFRFNSDNEKSFNAKIIK